MILKYKEGKLSVLEKSKSLIGRIVSDYSKPLVVQVKSITMTEFFPVINGRYVIDEKFNICEKLEICVMTKQGEQTIKSNSVEIHRG